MNKMFSSLIAAAALGTMASFAVVTPAAAAKPEIYTGAFSSQAVGGYDAVAYFTEGKPVKGDKQFETDWKGATWRFSSSENRDSFIASPESYAPQYGGYCAWAMADGKFAKGDPDYWRIVDGKLYLNFNADVQKKWEKDIPGFITKANSFWPAILGN